MSLGTLVKFQEQQQVETEHVSTIAPSAATTTINSEIATTNEVQSKRRRGPKGSRAASTTDADIADEVVVPTRKQWASKVLPQKKDSKTVSAVSSNSRNANNADLQRFFRTELLTAEEEYSLGMKVHFMMKCEEVHEGLCEELERMPSMEEWANACG
jgi:hypothetical protein